MSIIDTFLAMLTPYECLGCTIEGSLLCMDCIQQLTVIPERCYRCRRFSSGSVTCPACSLTSGLYNVHAGTDYSGIAKELIRRLKFSGAKSAARHMAERLLPLLDNDLRPLIVPVPTATSRVRSRGYDQAKLLARELSRQARLPYLDCIVRSGHTHQVGASRHQRMVQLHKAFRVRDPEKIRGTAIVLIDDVLTTGATLEAAAKALSAEGAERVSAVVFAQA